MRRATLILAALAWTMPAHAKSFKVAALLSAKVASDYLCIVEGVLGGSKIGDVDVAVTTFDYDNSLPKAVELARRIASESYDLVIGPRTSQEALATADILGRTGIPQILPVASHPDIPKKSPLALRMVASGERYAALTSRFVATRLKPKKVLIVSNLSQPYSTFYRDAFSKRLKADAPTAEIQYVDFIDGFSDFGSVAEKLRSSGADVVYAPLQSIEFTALFASIAATHLDVRLVTHAGLFEARDILLKHYRPGLTVYFNGIWDLERRGPDVVGFDAVQSGRCKSIPVSVRSAAAYDASAMTRRVLEATPGARGAEFARRFRELRYTGLLGQWKLDESGDPLRPLPMFEMTKEGFELAATLN